MQNNIVYESAKNIKSLARQTMEGRWKDTLFVMLFATFISDLPRLVMSFFDNVGFVGYLLDAYNIVIKAPIMLGLAMYFIKVFRGQPAGTQDIKNAFNMFPNAVSLYLSIWLRTTIGFMLFVIPGIFAMLKYSQAFFIMAENPQKHYRQCMMESKILMAGNMKKYALLILSIVPVLIVFMVPQIVVNLLSNPGNINTWIRAAQAMNINEMQTILSQITYNNQYLIYCASLISLIFDAYLFNTQACFYDLMTGNLVVKDDEQI